MNQAKEIMRLENGNVAVMWEGQEEDGFIEIHDPEVAEMLVYLMVTGKQIYDREKKERLLPGYKEV